MSMTGTVRYYVNMSTDLAKEYKAGNLRLPDGWRLVKRWGPRYKEMECWIVEDDFCSEDYADYLVMPIFKMTLIGDGPEYNVTVSERTIMPSP